MKKQFCLLFVIVAMFICLVGCMSSSVSASDQTSSTSTSSSWLSSYTEYIRGDITNTIALVNDMIYDQPTPIDIEYSLERYNLIRRAYWVNGEREKANTLACPVEKPLGYCLLLTDSGAVIGRFTVDGKVTSLNSYLTPDTEYSSGRTIPDIDGSYGENDDGIFFFTIDGRYIEWNGTYLYSDIPFEIDDPVLKMSE